MSFDGDWPALVERLGLTGMAGMVARHGELVSFTISGKVTKVKTNAKGVAVLSKLAKGSTVQVSFGAVTGKYAAAKAVSAKVL